MARIYTILIITFLLFSCKAKTENEYQSIDINSQLREVTSLQDKNNFLSANKLLESLVRKKPDNAELYFRLAHSKTISNPELFEIMKLLDQCLKINPMHSKALYLKSQGLMFMGKFKDALEIESKLLERFPNNFILKADKASTLLFNGDLKKAIEFAKSILPETENIYEIERLTRIQVYANYFLGNIEKVKVGKDKLRQLGFETNYLNKLIDSKELKFENFAVGKNVGNVPCSLQQLNIMFPEKE